MKSSPLTKLKWPKRMSLLTSMHFTMIACSSRVKEIITKDIQIAQDILKRKLERVRKALERREREKDVILKEGPLWDEARTLFKKKELTLEKNEDRVILDYIRELRSQLPDIHKFYEVLL